VRRRGQSKRIIGRSLLCQFPRRAFRLALCINAVLLLGGCGVNYRFCPPGTEKDPSRPFTTCKTTTPAKIRSCCFAVDRFDSDAPSGIARRGVTMPVREMTKIVEHESMPSFCAAASPRLAKRTRLELECPGRWLLTCQHQSCVRDVVRLDEEAV
jgi:hypothetical protein